MSVETHGDGTLEAPGASVLGTAPLPAGARVAVIVSRYHSLVTQKLLDGALAAAKARGAEVDVVPAPGAFELGSSRSRPRARAATRASRRSAA